MVENYKNKHEIDLAYFVKNNIESDFYIIKDGRRKLINDDKTLKLFLKQSKDVRITEHKGDILGVSGILKFKDNNVIKECVKINAINSDIFEKLLVVNIWNTKNNLNINVKRNYKFMNILKNKGFEILSSNENEVNLMYNKYKKREYNK
jgi:hypothetical protein